MSRATDRAILNVIASLEPESYGNSIFHALERPLGWLGQRFPMLHMIFGGPSMGAIYAKLYSLERRGLVRSELSIETFPERGNRHRRYYFLTESGRDVVK